jgi:hypothetical protein
MADTRASAGPPSSRPVREAPLREPPAPAPRGRPAVWPIVAVVLAAAGLALAVVVQAGRWTEHVSSPAERDQARVAALVETYLAARRERDGNTACAQLSEGQRREIVARVAELRMADASPSRCAALVANMSPHSRFTSPALQAYDGHEVDVSVSASGVAAARPAGLPGPVLFAWKREDDWELDGSGVLGAQFIAGCRSRADSDSYCGCVFDELRARNPGRPSQANDTMVVMWKRMMKGDQAPLLRTVTDECGATELQAAEGAGRSSS